MRSIRPIDRLDSESRFHKHGVQPSGAPLPMDNYALYQLQNQHAAWYWGVHFQRRRTEFAKRFYHAKYGGNARARKAARSWRDEQLAQVDTFGKLEFCQQKRSNNTRGVPGVHFHTSVRQPLGCWQAKLKLAGRRAIKSFSVRQHTFKGAYSMAVAARMDMLAREQDEAYLYTAVAKRKSKRPPSAAAAALVSR